MITDSFEATSSKKDLLGSLQDVLTEAISGSSEFQKAAAERLDYVLSTATNWDIAPLVKFFGGSSKTKGASEHVKHLLRAIEVADDDLTIILLCRIGHTISGAGDDTTRAVPSKMLKRLIKADACSSLIRGLRKRLKVLVDELSGRRRGSGPMAVSDTPLRDVATDAMAALLLAYGTRDGRLTLKMRVGGILPSMCSLVQAPDMSPTILRLLCRAVRSSPRNAQLCGRQRDFGLQLIQRISQLAETGEPSKIKIVALHIEIVYFISKNRRTRLQLIQDGVVAHVLAVLDRQLEARRSVGGASTGEDDASVTDVHTELSLIVLAGLRLLANNKKAKNELVSLGAIAMCERAIGDISKDSADQSPTTKQLQDSLCALCLRCLPTVEFPLAGVPFPLRFPLPRPTSPARRSRSLSKSPMKGHKAVSNAAASPNPSPLKSKSFDDGALSSDDDGVDEEDEVFCGLDDSEIMRSEGEDDERETALKGKKDPATSFTKQKLSELAAYEGAFSEFKDGAPTTQPVPWNGYEDAILKRSMSTSSVVPMKKLAYPEWADPDGLPFRHPLAINKDSMKEMVVQQMARARLRAPFNNKIVYDVDMIYAGSGPLKGSVPQSPLTCDDRTRVGKIDSSKDHLLFESRFESGNLRRATQVGPHHYELILSPDINQIKEHYQWFYFEVSNMKSGIPYTFEIVNCLKTTSMYSKGMQPVMYSVREAMAGRGSWERAGDSVCYYRNLYTGADETDAGDDEKTRKRYFYSLRFNMTFANKGDVCYMAYHFPYTYSYMKATLDRYLTRLPPSVYYRSDVIGLSLGGNPVQMLTITAPGSKSDVSSRDTVVLSARVHPGESNASWMMHGILEALLTSSDGYIAELLQRFVVKVIPMLNPDGVINGSHRCSLAGVDLNRVWDRPTRLLHPEIYHSKGVIQYLSEVRRNAPWVFVDLHGHSRRSNVFVFGNNPEESYRSADKEMIHNYEFMTLPEILEQTAPAFSFKNSRFSIARGKESSARVAVWRQFGVARAYTMEATYCGFETGAYRGYQIGTRELKEMGRQLLAGIVETKRAGEKRKKARVIEKSESPKPLERQMGE